MHSDLAVVPGMPWIIDVAPFPNMGVVLLTCITVSEIIKALATCSSSLIPTSRHATEQSDAEAASAACSITMTELRDDDSGYWILRDCTQPDRYRISAFSRASVTLFMIGIRCSRRSFCLRCRRPAQSQ